MKKPRWRMTIGLLMLLVAIVAVGLRIVEESRRIRVYFENKTTTELKNLRIEYAGRVEHVGTVSPRAWSEIRLPYASNSAVRLCFDVPNDPNPAERHVELPRVIASGPGDLVSLFYGEP